LFYSIIVGDEGGVCGRALAQLAKACLVDNAWNAGLCRGGDINIIPTSRRRVLFYY